MAELSDEEREEIRRVLASLPEDYVNLIALDQKYDKEWYEEQLYALAEIDEYLAEVSMVMGMCGRNNIASFVDTRRTELRETAKMFESAMEELDGDYNTSEWNMYLRNI